MVPGTANPGYIFLATATITHPVHPLPNPVGPTQALITEQQPLHLPGSPTPPPKSQNVSHFLERLEGDLQ